MENEDMELELTNEQIARNDDIDNAVYQCVLTLAEHNDNSLPWDIRMISEVTDAIKEVLWNGFSIKVRHPAIVTKDDGTQYYSEYDYDEEK